MTTGISDYGAQLYTSSGSAGTYAVIGEVVKITPPEIKSEKVDLTNHASTDGYKEFKPSGTKEVGEFDITLNLSGSPLLNGFYTSMNAKTTEWYKVAFPTSSGSAFYMRFEGFVTSVKPSAADAQNPKALQVDVKIQPTGKPDFVASL